MKHHQKLRFWCFPKEKKSMCRRGTKARADLLDFQYNKFFMLLFIVKKLPLCMKFSISHVDFILFLNVPHFLWIWNFVDMYLTYLETKIWRGTFYIYFKKMVFLAFNTLLSPFGTRGKNYSSTLNIMILQTSRNKCERFGGHVDIELSYKILQFELLKEARILFNSPCFQ